MNFRYGQLPSGQGPLPVVNLDLLGRPGLRLPALVDSGAAGVRLDAELAIALGVDVSAMSPRVTGIGGQGNLLLYDVPGIRLGIGKFAWSATVGFVSPWPYAHALLGTEGFFDAWNVRFDKRRDRFSLTRQRARDCLAHETDQASAGSHAATESTASQASTRLPCGGVRPLPGPRLGATRRAEGAHG